MDRFSIRIGCSSSYFHGDVVLLSQNTGRQDMMSLVLSMAHHSPMLGIFAEWFCGTDTKVLL